MAAHRAALAAALGALLALAALPHAALATATCQATGTPDFSAAATPCGTPADRCTTCYAAVTAPLTTAGACVDGSRDAQLLVDHARAVRDCSAR